MKKLASIVLSTFVGTVAVFVAFHGNASLLNTAGLLAVVGDVDPWDDLGSNDIFYDAFLGDSQNILFWSRPAPNANLLNYYSNSPGVTTTVGGSAVPDMLDGVDLLVMSLSFDVGLFTFPAEINAIKDFLKDGGSVLVMAESDDASTLATYNRFLSDIGSSISYTGAHSRSVTLRPPPDHQRRSTTCLSTSSTRTVRIRLAGALPLTTAATGRSLRMRSSPNPLRSPYSRSVAVSC